MRTDGKARPGRDTDHTPPSSPTTQLWRLRWERMYSSYSFITSALAGREWSALRPGRALPPGKGPPVPTVQETEWPRVGVETEARGEIVSALPEIEPRSPGRPVRS
jgi:hypothetical protein